MYFYLLEPLKLEVGNEYNLNNVKQIEVTDAFLTLDKTVRDCQNEESLEDCQTKEFIEGMLEQCKCLPYALGRINDEVQHNYIYIQLF